MTSTPDQLVSPQSSTGHLVRGLGLVAAISVNVANIIGTGVFIKARVMTCNVGSPFKALAVWVVAGVLSLAGALTYAELLAMMPEAAGEYGIMRRAYGRGAGFIYGWTQFLIARSSSAAALAVGFAIFLNDLVRGGLKHDYFSVPVFPGYSVPVGRLQLVALGAIGITALINCAAVKVSGHFATVLTSLKVLLVIGVGIGAFVYTGGHWDNLTLANIGGTCEGVAVTGGGLAGFSAAMLGALWAYDGWNNISFMAGEVKRPERNLPLGLIASMFLVIGLYLFVNFGYYHALAPTEVASVSASSSVATEVVKKFLGPAAVSLMAMGLMVSSFGALQASMLATARVPYAMSRDRLFFPSLARVSPHTHVPIRSLLAQALLAAALVLVFSASYDSLTDYSIFALILFYALVAGSVFIFRRRIPHADRPYRTWGYPVVPVLYLLVTTLLIINTIMNSWRQSVIGLVLILVGVPIYLVWLRKDRDPNIGQNQV
jgi:APA family basic amino acid/polyamine antiporter